MQVGNSLTVIECLNPVGFENINSPPPPSPQKKKKKKKKAVEKMVKRIRMRKGLLLSDE